MNRNARALLAAVMALPCLMALNAWAAGSSEKRAPGTVRHLEWIELLPRNEREGYIPGPPPPVHGYLEGLGIRSFGKFDQKSGELDCSGLARRFNPDCENVGQASLSGAVNEALDGQLVRLAGYIVPLEVAPNGRVTEFFLAAYAGACIHVPPPAPNQMVYVKVPGGQRVDSIYDAYSVTGVLHTRMKAVGINAAGYSLELNSFQRMR